MDKDDVTVILTSLASSVTAALAWISGFQLLLLIISAFAVAVLTFYFNSKMQKRAWKREVTVKMISELYGPLYIDVSKALQEFSKGDAFAYRWYRSDDWARIRADYHYRVIPLELRNKLDIFYALLDQISANSAQVIRLVESMLLKSVRQEFGVDIEQATWTIHGFRNGVSQGSLSFPEVQAVLNGFDLVAFAKRQYGEMDSYRIFVSLQRRRSNEMLPQEVGTTKEQEIFARAIKEISENQKVKSLKDDERDMISEGISLRERLGSIVETPWKV